MSLSRDDTEDSDTGLLKALAWTPTVAPFQGTDRYQLRACLGEGGFGVVYEVEDRETGRHLALKTLKPQRSGYAANIRRLKREFRSVADIAHPNLVGLHELSSHAQRWFFTMDLVRGCEFRDYVRPANRLDEQRLRGALGQLVAGVGALHQAGVLHRDLKPSNVLVEQDGRVLILDFGLAGDDIDPVLYAAGTPSFMSPEQRAGEIATAASDWYSVGVMLHEALVGELPALDRDLLAAARAPADLGRLCSALLQAEPSARPAVRDIRALLGDLSGPTDVVLGEAGFVGRKRELAVLRDAFAGLRDGATRLVRVSGEPGVGKSALLERFRAELPDDAVVLAGKCHERESVPFKAFDGAIDALVTHLRAMTPGEQTRLLPRDISLATQLFPVLGEVELIRDMPRPAAPVDPSQLRLRSFRALKELLAAVAASQPLVIVIDDLQWGDLDSARLLQYLLATPVLRTLIVLAYRSSDSTEGSTLGETLRLLGDVAALGDVLSVNPLAQDEARELAGMLLGNGTVAAQTVADRAEGHPMFMAELAHGVARSEAIDEVPSLVAMLWRRIDRLAPPARALVETLAVAGGPLPQRVCCAAAGVADESPQLIRVLRSEHLLRVLDGDLNVFHDRIRDAVGAFIDPPTRARRHLAIAETLERGGDSNFEAIARHFDGAGKREAAGTYALRAADAAMSALAFDRAAALYQLAIDRGQESADVYHRLGDAWLAAGASSAGGNAYLEAARRSEGAQAIDLMSLGGRELCCAGDSASGEQALRTALRAFGQRTTTKNMLSVMIGMYHLVRMRLAKFRAGVNRSPDLLHLEVLERAAYGFSYMGVARSLGLTMRSARCGIASGEPRFVGRGLIHAAFGMIANHPERPAVIDELLDRAHAISREHGDLELEALALRLRGESHFMYGNLPLAARMANEASTLISDRCLGMGFHRRFTTFIGARSMQLAGDAAQARALGEPVLAEAIDREDPVCADSVRALLAFDEVMADRPDTAREHLELTNEDIRCGNLAWRGEAKVCHALYRGDAEDAVALWDRYMRDIKREGVLFAPMFRVLIVRSYCSALFARGSRRDVARAKRLARRLRGLRFPAAFATRAAIDANLALAVGGRELATTHLARARDVYAATGFWLDAATANFARARLAGDDIEAAATELRACGVESPERWTTVWYPRAAG